MSFMHGANSLLTDNWFSHANQPSAREWHANKLVGLIRFYFRADVCISSINRA
jgi:hypothetical protein